MKCNQQEVRLRVQGVLRAALPPDARLRAGQPRVLPAAGLRRRAGAADHGVGRRALRQSGMHFNRHFITNLLGVSAACRVRFFGK